MEIMDDLLDLMDSVSERLATEQRRARSALRGESGYATLVTVLVIMAIGAVIITPLLALVIQGHRSGATHNQITDRLYAADTGIQDGLWRVQSDDLPTSWLGTWGDIYGENFTYQLPTQINGCDVTVLIRAKWLLEGLESAHNGRMPHANNVTVSSSVVSSGVYKMVLIDKDMPGNWKAERIAVWLPAGYEYVAGSSNLEKLATTDPAYIVPTVSDWNNGHTVIWDYAASAKQSVAYIDLPAETTTRRYITFNFTPAGSVSTAFSWVRTNSNDVYLSWSGDIKQFQIEATATDPVTGASTTVIAANMKNDGVSTGMAINGDYEATGNALIRDYNNDSSYRERLYQESSGVISGIPDGGTARKLILYWSGWKSTPPNTWHSETTYDVSQWTEAHRTDLYNLVPNYKMDKVCLKVKIGVTEYLISSQLQADSWQVVPGAINPSGANPWDYPNGWYYSCKADVTALVKTRLAACGIDVTEWSGEAEYIVGHAQESTSMASDEILQGVHGNSASDVYVVGDSGTIIWYNGSSWQNVAVGSTDQDLKDVVSFPTGDVWTVGDSYRVIGTNYYTILHKDNATDWGDGDGGITGGVNLKSIWGEDSSYIYAVGDSGTILMFNGSTWVKQTNTRTETLRGIWGSSATDAWAVGDAHKISKSTYCYTLLHTTNGGANWTPVDKTGNTRLYSIWGTDANHIFAVGEGGTILYCNNGSGGAAAWTAMTSHTTETLYGVWGTSVNDVFAVGASGTIMHYDGSSWSSMTSGCTRYLYGAWGTSGANVYVAGESTTGGTLIHYNGVDDNGDGSVWDPVTGGAQMYDWDTETAIASTDYPLGDPAQENTLGHTDAKWSASYAAWSIMDIYTSPETKGHQIYIFDTLQPSGRYNTRSFDIEGFLAPANVLTETEAARITCFVGEGDQNLLGENIYLKRKISPPIAGHGTKLNTGADGTALDNGNVWNSISNEMSADGIDIDTFSVRGSDGVIQPSDSGATVTLETGQDVWNLVYLVLSMRSDLSGTGLLTYIVK